MQDLGQTQGLGKCKVWGRRKAWGKCKTWGRRKAWDKCKAWGRRKACPYRYYVVLNKIFHSPFPYYFTNFAPQI